MGSKTLRPLILRLSDVVESQLSLKQLQMLEELKTLAPETLRKRVERFRRRIEGGGNTRPTNRASKRSLANALATGLKLNCLHPDPATAEHWLQIDADGPLGIGFEVIRDEGGDFEFLPAGEGGKRIPRRRRLKELPSDWFEKSLESARSSSTTLRSSLLILALTGCRPCEIETLEWSCESTALILSIICAKKPSFGNVPNPIQRRQFKLLEHGDLGELVSDLNGILRSDSSSNNPFFANAKALENLCARISKKLWPEVQPGLNPSCYRNLFAADLKRAGLSRYTIAELMGHDSEEMASTYGTWGQGRSNRRGYLHINQELDSHREAERPRQ